MSTIKGKLHPQLPLQSRTPRYEGKVTWELDPAVQNDVAEHWSTATSNTITALADLDWFSDEVRRLYGFSVPGVDYTAPVETDVPWPAPTI